MPLIILRNFYNGRHLKTSTSIIKDTQAATDSAAVALLGQQVADLTQDVAELNVKVDDAVSLLDNAVAPTVIYLSDDW